MTNLTVKSEFTKNDLVLIHEVGIINRITRYRVTLFKKGKLCRQMDSKDRHKANVFHYILKSAMQDVSTY